MLFISVLSVLLFVQLEAIGKSLDELLDSALEETFVTPDDEIPERRAVVDSIRPLVDAMRYSSESAQKTAADAATALTMKQRWEPEQFNDQLYNCDGTIFLPNGWYDKMIASRQNEVFNDSKGVEYEKEAPLDPCGLDPQEVLNSLPVEMQDACVTQDIQLFNNCLGNMDEDMAEYHMKRCVDTGLLQVFFFLDLCDQEGDENDDAATVLTMKQRWEPEQFNDQLYNCDGTIFLPNGWYDKMIASRQNEVFNDSKGVEYEKEAPLDPCGLDPQEVLNSLPVEMQDACVTQDIQLFNNCLGNMDEDMAEYHMKRCVDTGLLQVFFFLDLCDQEGDENDDAATVLTMKSYWKPEHDVMQGVLMNDIVEKMQK
eukprot:23898_1